MCSAVGAAVPRVSALSQLFDRAQGACVKREVCCWVTGEFTSYRETTTTNGTSTLTTCLEMIGFRFVQPKKSMIEWFVLLPSRDVF